MNDDLQLSSLDSLAYLTADKDVWKIMPEWVMDLLLLGAGLSKKDVEDTRRVLALKVPVRAYACSLLGAGITLERNFGLAGLQRRLERFERLWKLADGSPVYIFQNRTRFRGQICAHEEAGEIRRIRVQTDVNKNGSGTTWIVPPELAHIIQPADHNFQLHRKQAGKFIELPELLTRLCDRYKVPPAWYSSLECLMVGTASKLEADLELGVSWSYNGGIASGTLGDLVLSRRCVPQGEVYRSDILSSTAEDMTDGEALLAARTIVLVDGATPFLRMGELWPSSDLVVLLDPYDSAYGEAVQLLNRWYATRRVPETDTGLQIPLWTEAMTFREKVRQ